MSVPYQNDNNNNGGVRLKRFEHVISSILSNGIQPRYMQLPSIPSSWYNNTNTNDYCKQHDDTHMKGNEYEQESLSSSSTNTDWLYHTLSDAARVYGPNAGQLSHYDGAIRKEQQICSMVRCIIPFLLLKKKNHNINNNDPYSIIIADPISSNFDSSIITTTTNLEATTITTTKTIQNTTNKPTDATNIKVINKPILNIVDFGGGSGHLSIPLALLIQQRHNEFHSYCNVVCVDLNEHSLKLLHQKANNCICITNNSYNDNSSYPQMNQQHESSERDQLFHNDNRIQRCRTIPNLYTFHGSVKDYVNYVKNTNPSSSSDSSINQNNMNNSSKLGLDIAVALHLCGEATDVVLHLSETFSSILGFIVAPCCVGKLQVGKKNPYIYQATGYNTPTIHYPQSYIYQQIFQSTLTEIWNTNNNNDNDLNDIKIYDDWNSLAKAADYSDSKECRTNRNASRRIAKTLLEMDRCYYIEQQQQHDQQYQYHYHTCLVRMEPWEASPKNDIIIAWKHNDKDDDNYYHNTFSHLPINHECQNDLDLTIRHLFNNTVPNIMETINVFCEIGENNNTILAKHQLGINNVQYNISSEDISTDCNIVKNDKNSSGDSNSLYHKAAVDWSKEEVDEIQRMIMEFLNHHNRKEKSINTKQELDNDNNVLIFPTGMGCRKRKLIHYIATQMKLRHWGIGKKSATKTVAVAPYIID